MEKMMKTAGTLDAVCKVLRWLCIAALALAAAGVAVMLVAPSVARGMAFTLNVGGSSFDMTALPLGSLRVALVLWLAAFGLALACVLYTLRTLRAMLVCMKAGRPFEASVADNFHRLGVFTLAAGAGGAVLNGIITAVLTAQLAGETSFTLRFDFTFLLAAAVLFLLAYVFRYGEQLQQQADETL